MAREGQMTDLVNRGVVVLNDHDDDGRCGQGLERTILVTGVARGGTTMLAQVLDRLGLFMGDALNPASEDSEIMLALENFEMGELKRIIVDRNVRFEKWGFKAPNLYQFLPVTEERWFRNPRCIAVFRDPLAIARRNELSEYRDRARAIREAGEELVKLTSYVSSLSYPALLISYEKALQNAEHVIESVARFCGLTPSNDQKVAAFEAIVPNNPDYISSTAIVYRGTIDEIVGTTLRGWCRYRNSDEVVEIEVFIDEKLIGLFAAGDFRDDLEAAGMGLGFHAFNVDLTPYNIKGSSVILVRPARYQLDLRNSFRSVDQLRAVAGNFLDKMDPPTTTFEKRCAMQIRPATTKSIPCKICQGATHLSGVVDFERSCMDQQGRNAALSAIPIYYRRCESCHFLFTDAFDDWPAQAFLSFIYNEAYLEVDPDYESDRPLRSAANFLARLGDLSFSVLDYGGGDGKFAARLRAAGVVAAKTYDPFNPAFAQMPSEKFRIVTCYECIEHVTDPLGLVREISALLEDDGLIHVATGILRNDVTDTDAMKWWYVAPRNGHISIFSPEATSAAWSVAGFRVEFIAEHSYVAYRRRPKWAEEFIANPKTQQLPPDFDQTAYLLHNPDVQKSGINPITHYINFGQFENRKWA